ncbi:hypothetical protein Tco_1037233 [Tanacetum coccineum]
MDSETAHMVAAASKVSMPNLINQDGRRSLLEAVEKRFGGNAGTKKTHRNLLKRQMLLRSLSPIMGTAHAVVWKNKPELEIISMDDLYNNLKVYKPEVKGTSSTQNMAFVSSNNSGSTNEVVNSSHEVTAASTQANAANSTNNLQQLHPDDLEEMDLRWQMAMLTMRQEGSLKKHWKEANYGLSEERPTNYALMGYSSSSSDSEVSNDSTCSKSCLEIVEVHKSHNEQLLKDLKKSQLMGLAYKTVENSKAKTSEAKPKVVRKNNDAPIIKDLVYDSEEEDVHQAKIKKKTEGFDHLQNMVPRAVLMKSGLVSVNTARQVNAAHSKTTVNAARPMSYLSKTAHSTVKRHIHKNTPFKNNYEKIDGGYVAFGGNPKGGKFTGKDVWNKNKQSDLVSKRIERNDVWNGNELCGELGEGKVKAVRANYYF